MANTRKIFSVDDLSDGDVSRLFFAANEIKKDHFLTSVPCHKQIMLAFFEPSTRTKLSFEMAGHKIGARMLNFDCASSSQIKGESKWDTLKTLAALRPDLVVIRQKENIVDQDFADLDVNMINAGDGTNEHPTQALLDCFTLLQKFRRDELSGKKILICGDVARSRVYHSNAKLMRRLGAQVFVMMPAIFENDEEQDRDHHYRRFEQIKEKVDVVMILRVQEERMQQTVDRAQYFRDFGLTYERFFSFGPDCLLMHPGPMNAGVEIDGRLSAHERSLVLTQVSMGVIVRMAVLKTLFSFGESYA